MDISLLFSVKKLFCPPITSLTFVLAPPRYFLVYSRRIVSSRIFLSFSLLSDYSSDISVSRFSRIWRSLFSSSYSCVIFALSVNAFWMFWRFFSNLLLYMSLASLLCLRWSSEACLGLLSLCTPSCYASTSLSELLTNSLEVPSVSCWLPSSGCVACFLANCSSWIFLSLSYSFSYAILCLKAIRLFTSMISFLCILSLLQNDCILLATDFTCSHTCITSALQRWRRILL